MKRTAYALKENWGGEQGVTLFHHSPITCESTGQMADGSMVWTSKDIPGCWFSLHKSNHHFFFMLEGVN